jgi:hypothetical protein
MLFRREAQPGPSSIRVVPVPVPPATRIRMIEPQLRSQYDELLSEPVPGKLAELARRFEDVTATLLVRKGSRDGKDAPAPTSRLSR